MAKPQTKVGRPRIEIDLERVEELAPSEPTPNTITFDATQLSIQRGLSDGGFHDLGSFLNWKTEER